MSVRRVVVTVSTTVIGIGAAAVVARQRARRRMRLRGAPTESGWRTHTTNTDPRADTRSMT